jgi:hypothetical protein
MSSVADWARQVTVEAIVVVQEKGIDEPQLAVGHSSRDNQPSPSASWRKVP